MFEAPITTQRKEVDSSYALLHVRYDTMIISKLLLSPSHSCSPPYHLTMYTYQEPEYNLYVGSPTTQI